MKVRPFPLVLAATLVFLFQLTLVPKRAMALSEPMLLPNHQIQLPQTARFFPKDASLTMHWMLDPKKIPEYLGNTARSKKKEEIRKDSKKLIEGFFALTGLNFDSELAEWIGPRISFALFESDQLDKSFGWLMALSNQDENSEKRFLQSFWEKQSLKGIELKINNYRGVDIISGNVITSNNNSNILSTASVNNEILLIASDKSVLQNSLNVSQLSKSNQSGNQELRESIQGLDDGIALVTVSPKSLHSIFSLPLRISQREDLNGFVGSIQSNGRNIALDGVLDFQSTAIEPEKYEEESLSLLASAGGPAEGIAIINSPSEILNKSNPNPIAQWIGPVLDNRLQKTSGIAAQAITNSDKGALIWLKEPDGWVIGTIKGNPLISNIDEVLRENNETRSELLINNNKLLVWSKLITKSIQTVDMLETKIDIILSQESETNWWSDTLAAIQQKSQDGLQLRENQLKQLRKSAENQPTLELALNSNQAQQELSNWYPLRILQSIAGRSLTPILQGFSFSIDANEGIDNSSISLRARLDIA